MKALVDAGFFVEGATVRLASASSPLGDRALAAAMTVLADARVDTVTDTVLTGDTGSIGSTTHAVLRRAKEQGDAHVVLLGDRRLVPLAMSDAESVDALEVHWPSGAVTRMGGLAADRQLVLVEGEPAPREVSSWRIGELLD